MAGKFVDEYANDALGNDARLEEAERERERDTNTFPYTCNKRIPSILNRKESCRIYRKEFYENELKTICFPEKKNKKFENSVTLKCTIKICKFKLK